MSHSHDTSMESSDMSDMDMTSSSSSDHNHMDMMMKTYLHFTGGDVVLFETVIPRSAGAIFGACLITFILAILSRYVASAARGLHQKFSVRSKTLLQHYNSQDSEAKTVEYPAPKFILSHELARSVTVGVEVFLHYTLMLIVMTFNAAYIISVILGAVVGELAFGRLHRSVPQPI